MTAGAALSTSVKIKQLVTTEKLGSIQMITINRPEKRNAIDPPTAVELFQAVKEFEDDKDMTVAVLHGKGVCSYYFNDSSQI